MITLLELKEEQKKIAKKIRELKSKRKQARNGYVSGLDGYRAEYRYNHIAYCIARGRTYEQIEPTNKDDEATRRHVKYMYNRVLSNIEIPKKEAPDAEAVCSG